MDNFYVFEVLEAYCGIKGGIFKVGERFIGWEFLSNSRLNIKNSYAIKSNSKSNDSIPINKVKKVYKITFEDIGIM